MKRRTTRTNQVLQKIDEITDDRDIKRPLHMLFITMKHRRQWLDRKLQSDSVTQITKFLSQLRSEEMKLNGPNESYLAFLYETCKDDLDQIRVSIPSSSIIPSELMNTPNLFSVKYVPIRWKLQWSDISSIFTVLKWLGMGALLCTLFFMVMKYLQRSRDKLRRYKFTSNAYTTDQLNEMIRYLPQQRYSITNMGLR